MRTIKLRSLVITAAAIIAGAAPSGAKTLASVGGKALTDADVVAAYGYLPRGEALREAVEYLVEREVILTLAREKALTASAAEVSRAAALAASAHRPTVSTQTESFRRHLAEEITIRKYVDRYIYPRLRADEENLRSYFLRYPRRFLKRPPRDRAALERLYPRYRNEVLYRFVKSEISRLLKETGEAARASLRVEIFI